MKAQIQKRLGLKLLLLMLLAANMTWFHNLFQANSSNTELASETANSFSYDRTVTAPGNTGSGSHRWKARITQIKQTRTDVWGNVAPEGGQETLYEWSAQLEGCYGINCRVSSNRIRARDLGMSEADFNNRQNAEAVIRRIQEQFDPKIDEATAARIEADKKKKKEEEAERKRAEREAKEDEEIAACKGKRNDDGKFVRISAHAALSCRAEKIGGMSGDEQEVEFAELSGELRTMLASQDPAERRRGQAILKTMGSSGRFNRSMTAQLRAMRAGSTYLDEYSTQLRLFKSTQNPMLRQMALGKIEMLNQRFQMDSMGVTGNPDAAIEFGYWQSALDTSIQSILRNPNAGVHGQVGHTVGPAIPSVVHINQRTQRGGGTNIFYNRDQWFTGAQVTAPQNWQSYLTTNPYVNHNGRTSGLTIPQVGQQVLDAGRPR